GIIRSHFGTDIKLPDASWAVFWLTGALTLKRWWPALLMLACVAVDYFVIAGGVSAYCFTPAYPFLLPAYLSLWAMGRWSRTQLPVNSRSLLNLALSVLLGVTACFAISNLGFYLAAGYFAQLPASLYAQAVLRYWPNFLQNTTMYVGVGLLIHYIVRHLHAVKPAAQRVD
ncbi:MAG: hypothetical protein AB7T07_15610, partial [Steroidobacteraceae bacterium]